MSNGKKFGAYVLQKDEGNWVARVVRRRTSKGTIIEKEKSEFNSHADAQKWANEQLDLYLKRRQIRNQNRKKNRAANRLRQKERDALISGYSFRELAEQLEAEPNCQSEFHVRGQTLWEEVAYRMLRNGATEDEAIHKADSSVGRKFKQRLEKAKTGMLDTISFTTDQMAIASAQLLINEGSKALDK